MKRSIPSIRVKRKDCQCEIAREGEYPVSKSVNRAGHVVLAPGIEPGSKVFFRVEGGKKIIHFIDGAGHDR